jgi:hypothetical protein
MRTSLFGLLLTSAPLWALDGKDELDFNIRPQSLLATATALEDVAAASDHEQSVVAYVAQPGNQLLVISSDGRALSVPPAEGGFGTPTLLASGFPVQLDREGVRAAGDLGLVAWIQGSGPSGTGQVRFARRANPSLPWISGLSISSLPAGNATGLEVVLTRDAISKLYVGALIGGSLNLVSSPNGGLGFGAAQLASTSSLPTLAFDLEGQGERVAVAYTDARGPSGSTALWLRMGSFDALTNSLVLGPEQAIFAALGSNAGQPEVALEGDRVTVAFLVTGSGSERLWFSHSIDAGQSFFPADQFPVATQALGLIDGITSFDLEITNDSSQIAVAEVSGGISRIGRGIAVDPFSVFDWTTELVSVGTDPQFPRLEGNELAGNAPGSCSLVFSQETNIPGKSTIGAISADQDDGCEYHDDLVLIGPDSGVDPATDVLRFAAAYNRRYDNHIMPFITDESPNQLLVTGYRPLTLVTEDLLAGQPNWKFRFGHVPFTDSLLFVALSQSTSAGSLLLPDTRESGLALDAITLLGFSEPLFSTFLLTPNDPSSEGGETLPIPVAYPVGLSLFAVGVSIDPVFGFNKITDVVELP